MRKGQLMMRIVAGGYLAYIGFDVARDVIAKQPDNYVIYLIISIIFMVVGGIWCVQALKKYVKHDYVDIWRDDKEGDSQKNSVKPSVAEAITEEQEEEKVIETTKTEDTISSGQEISGKEE